MNGLTQFGLTLTVAMLPILGGLSFPQKNTRPQNVTSTLPDNGWDWDDLAKRSPVCDCVGKCPCAVPCECNTIPEAKLVVGPPPDSFLPKEIVPLQGVPVVETKFTQPAPQPIAQPKLVVAAKPQAAPTFYSSCGPGGCGTAAGSCGPGGCGTGRRGLFGRRR